MWERQIIICHVSCVKRPLTMKLRERANTNTHRDKRNKDITALRSVCAGKQITLNSQGRLRVRWRFLQNESLHAGCCSARTVDHLPDIGSVPTAVTFKAPYAVWPCALISAIKTFNSTYYESCKSWVEPPWLRLICPEHPIPVWSDRELGNLEAESTPRARSHSWTVSAMCQAAQSRWTGMGRG